MAQEAKERNSSEKNEDLNQTEIQIENDKNSEIIKFDNTSLEAENIEKIDLAVSNSRNLKMLYVASTLFYANNCALT